MTAHSRDIDATNLQAMLARTPHADLLRALVDRARATIGFFPAHNPRALEYPWVLANLSAQLRGLRVLDVGAGVNPLPFELAERCAAVTTLDNHPLTRDIATRAEWNEWGYLDYATIDARINSVRGAYEDVRLRGQFDAIYSVSVIEHLPGAVRRRWIARFAQQLEAGAPLLLTVDLVPGTHSLWNLSEGTPVEAADVHGDFATLLAELESAGFSIDESETERSIPDSRVDIGLIRARRRA